MEHEYGIEVINALPQDKYDAIILAVAHQKFEGEDIDKLRLQNSVLFDVKGIFNKDAIDGRL